jgi:hypothetical protein
MSSHAGGQNLPFFAPSLLALRIRGGQSHPDQTPDGVGTGWMAGLPAAPFEPSLRCRDNLQHSPAGVCRVSEPHHIETRGGKRWAGCR